jgi:hypothetical protein
MLRSISAFLAKLHILHAQLVALSWALVFPSNAAHSYFKCLFSSVVFAVCACRPTILSRWSSKGTPHERQFFTAEFGHRDTAEAPDDAVRHAKRKDRGVLQPASSSTSMQQDASQVGLNYAIHSWHEVCVSSKKMEVGKHYVASELPPVNFSN